MPNLNSLLQEHLRFILVTTPIWLYQNRSIILMCRQLVIIFSIWML